jgi:phage-related protein
MKPAIFVSSSKKDLKKFPEPVQETIGRSLMIAQFGFKPDEAKPLKGFGSAGVLEIIEDHDGDTYRAVYTVRFKETIYVLHCFQKKSKTGIKTPQQDIDLINQRLKLAENDWRERHGSR